MSGRVWCNIAVSMTVIDMVKTDKVHIKEIGDFLDHIYGSPENVKELSLTEARHLVNLCSMMLATSEFYLHPYRQIRNICMEWQSSVLEMANEIKNDESTRKSVSFIAQYPIISALGKVNVDENKVYEYLQMAVSRILVLSMGTELPPIVS